MKKDSGLVDHVRDYLQSGGKPDKTMKEKLKLDDDFVFDPNEAYEDPDSDSGNFSNNPAVCETEPKETADLDIYHQATGLIPLRLTEGTDEEYIPIGSTFKSTNATTSEKTVHTITSIDAHSTSSNYFTAQFTPAIPTGSVVMAVYSDVFLTKRNYYSSRDAAKIYRSRSVFKFNDTSGNKTERSKRTFNLRLAKWN